MPQTLTGHLPRPPRSAGADRRPLGGGRYWARSAAGGRGPAAPEGRVLGRGLRSQCAWELGGASNPCDWGGGGGGSRGREVGGREVGSRCEPGGG